MAASCVPVGLNWRLNSKRRVTLSPLKGKEEDVIATTEQLGTYLESFTEFQKRAAGRELPWLRRMREGAFARFCEVGFPTTHDEDWRFTNVPAIAQAPVVIAGEPQDSPGEVK